MTDPIELIERFYRAFAARDAGAMATCYDPEVHFRDEVFDLRGAEVSGMWRMLCANGKDLRIESSDIRLDGEEVSAHWDAWYTFSATGRKVHNSIDARFRFREGRVIEHVDRFDFWSWSRQALGVSGLLLGWTPFLRNKVQQRAASQLESYLRKKGG
ncbi:MAG: nuclear transport factor 2 family protein [Planctomycetota bacterium]|jgi:ketosteroid isomerase-like protein